MMDINYNKRTYGLDILRAYAIIVVVLSHGRHIATDLFENVPFIPWIDGVELFFVLSGFLIGSILIKIINKDEGLNSPILFNFWKRRWFRTLPTYYLILLVNVLLVKFNVIHGDLNVVNYTFFLFLHNFTDGSFGFYWESWSLSIEEWFYLFFPICVFLMLFLFSKKRAILISIILLITLPLLYRISIVDTSTPSYYYWDINFRKTVITRLDAIIYGVAAAYIKFYYPKFWTNSKNWLCLLGLTLCFINIYIPRSYDSFYNKTFNFCVTSLGVMLLLPKADSIQSFRYQYIGKAVTHISLISYSMYLVNLPLVQYITINTPPQTKFEQAYLYIIYWIATIVISTLLYRFFEKPIMDLRDKY